LGGPPVVGVAQQPAQPARFCFGVLATTSAMDRPWMADGSMDRRWIADGSAMDRPRIGTRAFRSSDHQTLRSSDLQTLRPPDLQIFRPPDLHISRSSDLQTLRSSDLQIFRPSGIHGSAKHRPWLGHESATDRSLIIMPKRRGGEELGGRLVEFEDLRGARLEWET